MNYLERLLRRALLEAPATSGGVLHDPFADEAPWPLDEPAARLVQPQAAAAVSISTAEIDPLSPPAADAPIWPEPAALDAPAHPRPEPPALQPASLLAVPVTAQAQITPPADLAPTAAMPMVPADEPLSALGQADAFMRALGSPLFAAPLMPEAISPVHAEAASPRADSPQAVAPQAVVNASKPLQPVGQVQLQPPEAPAPLAAPASAADPAVAAAAAQAAVAAASPATTPVPGRVAPSPQVITVLAAAAPTASSIVTSTYRFGIGQL
ncbi:Meckel syndrome type 1 protein [Andreprevotia lacus DSM 23236]|jgi:hypothetical protein|uniref:Meckel syndrome type 1 protein n=1 Tax=Andreprevotia lacus DSM 23236 TaxID=1121001 RepID=A0A1W1X709_9NEIS|nr:hypothetical protein [Andreprevotia lacus]SMC19735.1 Meckel syndrome type 1 protein [Andreprevotia lacus DSM 23236]